MGAVDGLASAQLKKTELSTCITAGMWVPDCHSSPFHKKLEIQFLKMKFPNSLNVGN